jgi:hypothetical protein
MGVAWSLRLVGLVRFIGLSVFRKTSLAKMLKTSVNTGDNPLLLSHSTNENTHYSTEQYTLFRFPSDLSDIRCRAIRI